MPQIRHPRSGGMQPRHRVAEKAPESAQNRRNPPYQCTCSPAPRDRALDGPSERISFSKRRFRANCPQIPRFVTPKTPPDALSAVLPASGCWEGFGSGAWLGVRSAAQDCDQHGLSTSAQSSTRTAAQPAPHSAQCRTWQGQSLTCAGVVFAAARLGLVTIKGEGKEGGLQGGDLGGGSFRQQSLGIPHDYLYEGLNS